VKFLTVVFSLIFAVSAEYNGYHGYSQKSFSKESIIGEAKWRVHSVAGVGVLKVRWREKYGPEVSVECLVVWESATQYKLVSSGLNVTLEKTNINYLAVEKD